MLFNSFGFLILFLPLVCLGYYLCASRFPKSIAQTFLVVCSLVFYSQAKLAYTPLLVGSILFNYGAGKIIFQSTGKRRSQLATAAVVADVAFLASFKYVNLFLGNSPLLSLGISWPEWEFPLGISFFTLQQVMYLVDCYEGLVPSNGLLAHAEFVSFFPTVTSGPLTKARQMVAQILQPVRTDAIKISQGLTLVSLGLCKKVVLADSFSRIADAGFSHVSAVSAMEAWASSVCYMGQIYFDFSGYSDMAIGIALFLGFTVPVNFRAPFRSRSVTEFWQRWHITLSQFITTYLYTPILRSFKEATLTTASVATLLAMTIAGLWHGPSWTFVIFGLLHGAALTVNHVWRKKIKIRIPDSFAWIATLVFLNVSFIFSVRLA